MRPLPTRRHALRALLLLAALPLAAGCAAQQDARGPVPTAVAGVRRTGVEVRFSVDMSLEMAWGTFDPARDLVVARGGHPQLGGSTGIGAVLTRVGATPRFVGWARFDDPVTGSVSYSFAVLKGGDPDDFVRERHTAERAFTITGDELDQRPDGGDGYRELLTPLVYFDHAHGWHPGQRLLGADLSYVPRLRELGAEYRAAGVPGDPLYILREHGFGVVRLRLWHTPSEPWHGLDATLAYAREVADAGLDLMLDIHYSDTLADSGHQTVPAAWGDLELPALADSVRAYTSAVVGRMNAEGILPSYVQIGNEIRGGLLWEHGRVGGAWDTPEQWSALATLLEAGISGVEDALPDGADVETIVHVDDGGDGQFCRWFYDRLREQGVDFDVIGLSFYPWWHGDLDELRANLYGLARRFGKKIIVVETAYPWTLDGLGPEADFVARPDDLDPSHPATPEGQASFLRELLATVEGAPGGLGLGVVYREPCFLELPGGPPNPWENMTLFDFEGDALPALGFAVPWSVVREGY